MKNKGLFLVLGLMFIQYSALTSADEKRGNFFEYIQPVDPISFFMIGAAPDPDTGDIARAFKEFEDPAKAWRKIQELKRKHGIRNGGSVFASFRIQESSIPDINGGLYINCGISASKSDDWDDIFEHEKILSISTMGGRYANLKYATRTERARAVAECLSRIDGMPKLKKRTPRLKRVYIDELSYRMGEGWIKKMEGNIPKGTRSQYKKAFRCLVSQAARKNFTHASGDTVVLKVDINEKVYENTRCKNRYNNKSLIALFGDLFSGNTCEMYKTVRSSFMTIHVSGHAAAKKLLDTDDIMKMGGLWSSAIGAPNLTVDGREGAVAQILKNAASDLEGCRRMAGLMAPIRIPDVSAKLLPVGSMGCR